MERLGVTPLHYGVVVRPHRHKNVVFAPSMFAEATIGRMSRDEIKANLETLAKQLSRREDLTVLRELYETTKIGHIYRTDSDGRKRKTFTKKPKSLGITHLEKILQTTTVWKPKERSKKLIAEEGFIDGYSAGFVPSASIYDYINTRIVGRRRSKRKKAESILTDYRVILRRPYLTEGGVSSSLEVTCQCEHHIEHKGKDPSAHGVTTDIVCYHIALALMEVFEQASKGGKTIKKLQDGETLMPYQFDFGLALEAVLRQYWKRQTYAEIDRWLFDNYRDKIVTDQFTELVKAGKATFEAVRLSQNFTRKGSEFSMSRLKEGMIGYLDRKGSEYEFRGYGRDFVGTPFEVVSLIFVDPSGTRVHLAFNEEFEVPLFIFKEPVQERAAEFCGNPFKQEGTYTEVDSLNPFTAINCTIYDPRKVNKFNEIIR